ncbi:hypothetical protein [Bradyrhizobium sp.]|uniref:hypothetical protein n=1 Tax=Bradyrhizobium sp. TaxID=376 RepID=UPI002D45B381|nr:hypothetical protein [Bradyrhizobium sp.]HZR76348.1 hypothetical protein [Bradyrhizobium sp.]
MRAASLIKETVVNGTFIGFCLTFSLIPYVLPVLTPTWRWLTGITIAVGALLSALWIQDWIVRSEPGFHAGSGDAFGLLIAGLLTTGFVSGVGVRALTLSLEARGIDRIAISVAGLPVAIAAIILFGVQHLW